MSVHTGPEQLHHRWRPLAWLALVAFMLNPLLVVAQTAVADEELLKAGDTLRLTVPGRPELAQEFVLDGLGQATIEPVGTVQLGGINVADASQLLKQKLRLFYPQLDALQLDVGRSGNIRIYVIGSVSQRGALNYESAPSLWDVLRSIGGPLENANLREARVIREVDGQPQVFPLDLSGVMLGEGVPIFPMKDGDTLIIPALQEGIPGVNAAAGVKVFGSVGLATIVPIEEGTPLMDVLMLAGAPTRDAQMKKINWIHDDGERTHARVVDLKHYLLTGDALSNPLIYPGDTINVEYEKPSWVRSNVPFVLGSLAAVATILLAWDRLVND